ncbi:MULTISPECIES: hypothetical protein [unclassified Variovorax]|uniref:hypothetical protein n=1 Tax=unclassified Variovorax TaxID=663243 RepID=UPI000BE36E11|nr:hypothetical protein [Variovorax sp. YR752]
MSEEKKRRKRSGATAIAIFSIAICIASMGASAQNAAQTWRCGSTYSDQPCEGGKTVKVNDHRSDEDRRAADAGTRSTQTQADRLERSRLSLEKAAYDRDQRAAREARSAALAERRLAMAEQREHDRSRKEAGAARKSSMSFSGGQNAKATGDAPERKKKKRKSAD